MKKMIFIILIIMLGKNSFLFSQGIEYVTFEHRALLLSIKYPATWKNYWFYDEYSKIDYCDLSRNEILAMIYKYGYYPIFYIKKYDEIYYGINPSIRITLQHNRFYLNDLTYLVWVLYNLDNQRFPNFRRGAIASVDNVIKRALTPGRTLTQSLNFKFTGNSYFLHFQTEDYVLDSNIYDENFNRVTDFFLYLKDNYIIVIETNYGRTISIEDKDELMTIIKNINLR